MKNLRNKKSFAILAGVLAVLIAVSGATYLWFYMTKNAAIGSGNAAKIVLKEGTGAAINFDKVLPGQAIDLGGQNATIDINRPAILRLGFTQNAVGKVVAKLAATAAPVAPHLGDYDLIAGEYLYTAARLNDIVKLTYTAGAGTVTFKDGNDGYLYALVLTPQSGINILGGVTAKFTGEFGGTPITGSRQFEQESVFTNFGIEASLVQCTEEAVEDVWGNGTAVGTLLAAEIAANADAAAAWAYVA